MTTPVIPHTPIDQIEKRLIETFKEATAAPNADNLLITWERVEPYAMDDTARRKRFSIGLVDQGIAGFSYKTGLIAMTWRVAVEWFIRVNSTDDVKQWANLARAEIFRLMMRDQNHGDIADDTTPKLDDVEVKREDKCAEGVMIFEIVLRTRTNDIRESY